MASNANYYQFQEAKVAIAMELVKRGWKIYGFHEDESDMMTDYWSPARWDGIAEKDGYIAVFDISDYMVKHYSGRKIETYNYNSESFVLSEKARNLIERLKEIRVDRGASAAEEETAKKKIEALKEKAGNTDRYIVIDHYPIFQANPPRSSWHVEKDGVIIAKGNGLAKFSDMKRFDEEYAKEELRNNDKESYRYKRAETELKIAKAFEKFLNRIDAAAGCYIGGDGKTFTYQNITVTEYKKENKAVECGGKFEDGQLFIVKRHFTHGIRSGYVYRIHNRGNYFSATRLNKKLTAELHGNANSANNFGWIKEEYFDKWLKNGAVAFCRIEEIKTPYEVQKCVKKYNK